MGRSTMVASDGLAPARCEGFVKNLLALRPAARGAGQACTRAAAKGSIAAAGAALRAEQGWVCDRDGRRKHTTRSKANETGVASGTLTPGGAAPKVREACRRAVRWASRGRLHFVTIGEYEGAHRQVCDAYVGAEAAIGRVTERAGVEYQLIYEVMRLAPNFGRSRGKLRGAAGGFIPLGAGRTRMSLAEAEVAAALARRAWRASEQALENLRVECERIGRYTATAEKGRVRLKRARIHDDVVRARGGNTCVQDEQVRDALLDDATRMVERLTAALADARDKLDRFYWGVWGSARRCKASAREVRVLATALLDAEHGDWWQALPGGQTWMEAAAASVEGDAAELGGEDALAASAGAGGAGCAVQSGDVLGSDSVGDDGEGEVGSVEVDGRQAADGGRADCGQRGDEGVEQPWGLQPRCDEHLWSDEARWREAVLQAVAQLSGEEPEVGGAVEPAECARQPVRERLWWS